MIDNERSTSEDRPTVSVVIVSYNTRAMTLECLSALYADLGKIPGEVFLVDNASNDGSPNAVREAFPSATVLEMGRNAGFGAANNAAMSRAKGEFLLLLNSDAFVKPGAIAAMLACMNRYPRVAAVGPRLLNQDGTLQRSCYRFPTPGQSWMENLWLPRLFPAGSRWGNYQRWPHDNEREVDWAIGACLLVRRSTYEEIGGFDERFFMYAEETDWQCRMRDAGWAVVFTPAAQVTHLGGSSGAAERPKIRNAFFQSHDRYKFKHHGVLGLIIARLATIVGSTLRLMIWSVLLVGRPQRRQWTLGKMRFATWMMFRQMTRWSLS